ncbi:MAG TPA: hypothetical protein VII13_05805 [Vicinamibacteria bacterium]
MPYQSLLDDLVRSSPHVQAALMLDATGEVVLSATPGGAARVVLAERDLLIGAYHGLSLTSARRAASRHEQGDVECLCWRYAGGAVVIRPLKDGYYLVVCLADAAAAPRLVDRTRAVQRDMNASL